MSDASILNLSKLRWISDLEGVWTVEGLDDDNLKTYYVQTDDYLAVKNQHRKCLVCGRKGSGKSAIKKKLLLDKSHGATVIGLNFEEIYFDDFFNKYESICKNGGRVSRDVFRFVFLVNLLKALYNNGILGDEICQNFLEDSGVSLVSLQDLIYRKPNLLDVSAGINLPIVQVQGKAQIDLTRGELDWFTPPTAALLNDLELFILQKIKLHGKPIMIAVDRIDIMRDDWEMAYNAILPALVEFTISFNKKSAETGGNGSKIILFIRTDLWNIYCRGKTDFGKYELDHMVKVSWPDVLNFSNPLFEVIEKRLDFLINKAEEKSKKKVYYSKPLLKNAIENTPLFKRSRDAEFFLNKTQLRPRDAIALFRFAIESDDYDQFLMKYSTYLYSEIKEEIKVPLEGLGGINLVEDVLREICGYHQFDFLAQEFVSKYANAVILNGYGSGDPSNDAWKVLEQLFEYSAIGWLNGGVPKFNYRESSGARFVRKEKYRLHDGLLKYFCIV